MMSQINGGGADSYRNAGETPGDYLDDEFVFR